MPSKEQKLDFTAILQGISVWALPVLIAITFHEAAHGYVAWKLGDDTPTSSAG